MPGRFKAIRCGRRWGKNVFGEAIAVSDAGKGRLVGWFAPENKRLSESYLAIADMLGPALKSHDKTRGVLRTMTGGVVEFWSLEDENAGRSRKYHRAIFDEAAFNKPGAIKIWERSVKPTLLDYRGSCLMMSNTNGVSPDNLLWQVCKEPRHGFVDFHAPSRSNPFLPLDEIETLRQTTPALIFQQEYEAEFVDFSGAAFFPRDSLLENGQPVAAPTMCEAVFCVIDTALKTGKGHDGTAVVYFALLRNHLRPVLPNGTLGPQYRLIILDWDIRQIEGAMLTEWLPNCTATLKSHALSCRAVRGSLGAMIEDKNSGTILLQHAQHAGWPAHAIDSKLTAIGKDERAIAAAPYFHQGLIKICKQAYEKVLLYKETTANHLVNQIVNFRIGDPQAAKRADDLADCLMYGSIVAFEPPDE